MGYNPDIHHRQSIRLQDYDYASAGAYFVTICVQNRERFFGGITGGIMQLNDAGRMVENVWNDLPQRFPNVVMDEFVIMPNHCHGIICSTDRRGEPCVRPMFDVRKPRNHPNKQGVQKQGDHKDRPYGTMENTLGRVIQAFKSITTVAYIAGVEKFHWPPFPGRLWQRDYYEHIIRNDRDLADIREYIINNPARWNDDPENPANNG